MVEFSPNERDPNKPWLYPSGNRLDPSDRLATPLKREVPEVEKGSHFHNNTFSSVVFGLSLSFDSADFNDNVSDSKVHSNSGDNAQSQDSDNFKNNISESMTYTNS